MSFSPRQRPPLLKTSGGGQPTVKSEHEFQRKLDLSAGARGLNENPRSGIRARAREYDAVGVVDGAKAKVRVVENVEDVRAELQ